MKRPKYQKARSANFFYLKTKKTVYLTILFLLYTFFLTCQGTVFAAPSEEIPTAVSDAARGTVQLILSCTDNKGNTYYIHQGTGFVAGYQDETQYILTTSETITADADALAQIRKWGGLSAEDALTTQISILLDSDILIPATVSSTGTSVPYALLTAGQPLNNIPTAKFDFCKNITRTQPAYLYGYNADLSLLGQTALPDITPSFQCGSITDISTLPLSLSCDISAESGCAGAPLFNQDGFVLGMFYPSGGNLELLPSDSIMELLSTLNIGYQSNSLNADYNVADDGIKQQLADLLSDCQQDVTLNEADYSKKTLTDYKSAINTAMEVMADSRSTKDTYQSSIEELKAARKNLRPKNFTLRIVQLVLAAVLLFLLFLNIRQYLRSRNYGNILHPAPASAGPEAHGKKTAALIRTNTSEVIWLHKKELRIGSDAGKVDYLIADNPAISRYHAAIIQKEQQYYLLDNHSTNHTSVNHAQLSPQQPWKLHDNDSILLADEPFTFRLLDAEMTGN